MRKNFRRSDIFAFIALVVSIGSIYFTVFYQNRDLSVSLIDSNVEYFGSKIKVKLLYNNQGNTYSTIVENHLIFYQRRDQIYNSFYFNEENQINDPVILIPGEQNLRNIDIDAKFTDSIISRQNLAIKDTIFVGLSIQYINQTGHKSGDSFPLGFLLVNEDRRIIKYKLEYNVFKLNGLNYYHGESSE